MRLFSIIMSIDTRRLDVVAVGIGLSICEKKVFNL